MAENGGDTVEEMRIYIANLGKYNEGELVGAWFTPPVDFEEVKERIGLNDEYEAVSYTHLDVYKRQQYYYSNVLIGMERMNYVIEYIVNHRNDDTTCLLYTS